MRTLKNMMMGGGMMRKPMQEMRMGGKYDEYGKGGKMPKELLEYFKKKNEAAMGMKYDRAEEGMKYQDGGRSFNPGEAFVMSGFENRPDAEGVVSGREKMFIAMPQEGGDPRVMDLRSAMKEFGYEDAPAMLRAMGVEAGRNDGALIAPGMQEADYKRRLRMALAMEGEDLDALQKRLGIGRVDYERSRDLPRILAARRGGM